MPSWELALEAAASPAAPIRSYADTAKWFVKWLAQSELPMECGSGSFEDRRDHATMRILVDNGMRLSSLAGLRYDTEDEAKTDSMHPRADAPYLCLGDRL